MGGTPLVFYAYATLQRCPPTAAIRWSPYGDRHAS